jgi:predicted RNase H-like nuclease (RuvC/YqgF family)
MSDTHSDNVSTVSSVQEPVTSDLGEVPRPAPKKEKMTEEEKTQRRLERKQKKLEEARLALEKETTDLQQETQARKKKISELKKEIRKHTPKARKPGTGTIQKSVMLSSKLAKFFGLEDPVISRAKIMTLIKNVVDTNNLKGENRRIHLENMPEFVDLLSDENKHAIETNPDENKITWNNIQVLLRPHIQKVETPVQQMSVPEPEDIPEPEVVSETVPEPPMEQKPAKAPKARKPRKTTPKAAKAPKAPKAE